MDPRRPRRPAGTRASVGAGSEPLKPPIAITGSLGRELEPGGVLGADGRRDPACTSRRRPCSAATTSASGVVASSRPPMPPPPAAGAVAAPGRSRAVRRRHRRCRPGAPPGARPARHRASRHRDRRPPVAGPAVTIEPVWPCASVVALYAAGPAERGDHAPATATRHRTAGPRAGRDARSRRGAPRAPSGEHAEAQPPAVLRGAARGGRSAQTGGRRGGRGEDRRPDDAVAALPGLGGAHPDEGGDGRREGDRVVLVEDPRHQREGQRGHEQPAAP